MLQKQPVRETNCDQRENDKRPEKKKWAETDTTFRFRESSKGHSSNPGQGFLGKWPKKRPGEQKSNRSATAEEPTVFFHK